MANSEDDVARFEDDQQVYALLGGMFQDMLADESAGPRLRAIGGTVQWQMRRPSAQITVRAGGDEGEPGVDFGDTKVKPDVVLTLDAETAHRFWAGELPMHVALSQGLIRAKGPVATILKVVPAVGPAREFYAARLAGGGSVVEAPADEAPAEEASEAPVADAAPEATETPVVEEAAKEEEVPAEAPAEEAPAEEPAAPEEPAAEEAPAEEPAAEAEAPAEEAPAEEPAAEAEAPEAAEAPVVEEAAKEEGTPAVEEAPAEEPATEAEAPAEDAPADGPAPEAQAEPEGDAPAAS